MPQNGSAARLFRFILLRFPLLTLRYLRFPPPPLSAPRSNGLLVNFDFLPPPPIGVFLHTNPAASLIFASAHLAPFPRFSLLFPPPFQVPPYSRLPPLPAIPQTPVPASHVPPPRPASGYLPFRFFSILAGFEPVQSSSFCSPLSSLTSLYSSSFPSLCAVIGCATLFVIFIFSPFFPFGVV